MRSRTQPLPIAIAIAASMLLAGCTLLTGGGGGADPESVEAELRAGVEALPEYVDGNVFFQDSTMTGTVISGVLVVEGDDRESATEAYEVVLETTIRLYLEQPGSQTASVLLEAHPAHDAATRIHPSDVLGLDDGTSVDSDDLAEHFGLVH